MNFNRSYLALLCAQSHSVPFHLAFFLGTGTMLDWVWDSFPNNGTDLDNDDAMSMYLMGDEL